MRMLLLGLCFLVAGAGFGNDLHSKSRFLSVSAAGVFASAVHSEVIVFTPHADGVHVNIAVRRQDNSSIFETQTPYARSDFEAYVDNLESELRKVSHQPEEDNQADDIFVVFTSFSRGRIEWTYGIPCSATANLASSESYGNVLEITLRRSGGFQLLRPYVMSFTSLSERPRGFLSRPHLKNPGKDDDTKEKR